MIDSHTHLDLCEGDGGPKVADTVAGAVAAGVTKMLSVGTDDASCLRVLAAADAHPQVWASVGRHPNSTAGFDDQDLERLAGFAAHPRCVAIGETGVDLFRDGAPLEDQQRAFAGHCSLARELDLAVVVHSRAAEEQTLETLRSEAKGLRVIIHCFSMPERIDECIAEGWWLSFAGNVTYPSAGDLRDAVKQVPAERLLVETDAPYLAPQPVRGKPNSPANVTLTAAVVAAERGTPIDQFDAEVESAAAEVFGW